MAKQTNPNPVGRPKRGEALVTEADYPEIYSRWIRGTSIHSLAGQYRVDWRTINYHLAKCRTQLRTTMLRDRNEVLEELAMIRSAAWECFGKSKRSLTHDEVQREVNRIAGEKGVSEEVAGQVVKQTTRLSMRDGDPTWLTVVLAAIDSENRIVGHYETGKREAQKPPERAYRAAGRTPAETHEAMAVRLLRVLEGRRAGQGDQTPGPLGSQPVAKTTINEALDGQTPARQTMPMPAISAAQKARGGPQN